MKKAKIFWAINLAILLIVEIVFAFMIANPAKDFGNISSYTVQNQSSSSISINPTTGITLQQNAATPTPTNTPSAGIVGMSSIIIIVFAALTIFGMLRGMEMVGGEDDK